MDFLARYGVQVDLQAGLPDAGGCSYHMVHQGEWIDYQPVNLVRDVDILASYELVATTTLRPSARMRPHFVERHHW